MNTFYGDWCDIDDMCNDFGHYHKPLVLDEGTEILFAWYTYESYTGTALVVFRKNGQLYEVNGSHCSCYGLEGQWEPEETIVESLRLRMENDSHYCVTNLECFPKAEFAEFLDTLF